MWTPWSAKLILLSTVTGDRESNSRPENCQSLFEAATEAILGGSLQFFAPVALAGAAVILKVIGGLLWVRSRPTVQTATATIDLRRVRLLAEKTRPTQVSVRSNFHDEQDIWFWTFRSEAKKEAMKWHCSRVVATQSEAQREWRN